MYLTHKLLTKGVAYIRGFALIKPKSIAKSVTRVVNGFHQREIFDAKRTTGAKAPSGHNRQRCSYCDDSNGRSARNRIEATSQAQQRHGGGESTSREHNRGPAQGNRAKSRNGEVGIVPNQRPEAVANMFLRLAGARGLTQLQLQKLVYIAHGWTLAFCNQPLTASEPEAWDRGPVYPELRNKISHEGSKPVSRLVHENDGNPFAALASEDRGAEITGQFSDIETQIINLVWGRYGHLHGFTLSDLTHQDGTPWHKAYHTQGRNLAISNTEIETHYTHLAQKLQTQRSDTSNGGGCV